ncbi:ANTAR domain-containing response regulator [Thiolapillus sp.]
MIEKGLPDRDVLKDVCEILSVLTQDDDLLAAIRLHRPDAVVLDSPSPGSVFLQKIKLLQKEHPVPVVIFSQDDTSTTISAAIEAGVAAYVVDAMNPGRIASILHTAIARFAHMQSLKEELKDVRQKLADRKILERAKGILMKNRQLSEDDAYRLLRKTAMEKNKKLVEIAEHIISAAELLKP